LLRDFLRRYGFEPFSFSFIRDNATGQATKTKIITMHMSLDVPVENEVVIKELYGWENSTVPVHINSDENNSFSFNYNLDTGACNLEHHRNMIVIRSKPYANFKTMLEALRANKENLLTIFVDE
jgi:hypothetical protein